MVPYHILQQTHREALPETASDLAISLKQTCQQAPGQPPTSRQSLINVSLPSGVKDYCCTAMRQGLGYAPVLLPSFVVLAMPLHLGDK